MEKHSKIYLAGSSGLIGSALSSALKEEGYNNVLCRTHQELDLSRQEEVEKFFKSEKPDYVFLAAAKVGGIGANTDYPGEFIYQNIAIQTNVIHSAHLCKVKKLLFFGSACSYPRDCPQPMKEECLLEGKLEPTNEAYAVAKISGIKLCQAYSRQYRDNFISAILTNAYGPADHFDSQSSHVIPALLSKFHRAKVSNSALVEIWGTGKPKREFIFSQDAARAAIFLMNNYDQPEPINVGTGKSMSIKELSLLIKEIVGYRGKIVFDRSKPDGAPEKLLDVTKLKDLGWQTRTSLREGLELTYNYYLKQSEEAATVK